MSDTTGLYSHNVHLRRPEEHVMNDPDLSKSHYGYTGDEEYGAYINRKKWKLKWVRSTFELCTFVMKFMKVVVQTGIFL